MNKVANEASRACSKLQRALDENGLLQGEIAFEGVVADLQRAKRPLIELGNKLEASEVTWQVIDEVTKRAEARAMIEKLMDIYEAKL